MAMLVVVVIGDGNDDYGLLHGLDNGSDGEAAAERGREDGIGVDGADGGDDLLCDGRIHGSADGVVAALARFEQADFGMRGAGGGIGLFVDDVAALLFEMGADFGEGAAMVHAADETDVDGERGAFGDDVARLRADVGGGDAAEVEGGEGD